MKLGEEECEDRILHDEHIKLHAEIESVVTVAAPCNIEIIGDVAAAVPVSNDISNDCLECTE